MLDCIIISLKETINYNNLRSVTIPADKGQMQILSNHAESFIFIKKGEIKIEEKKMISKLIPVEQGVCYIKNNSIEIIIE